MSIQNEKAFKEAQKYVAEGITEVTERTRKKIKKIIIESCLNNKRSGRLEQIFFDEITDTYENLNRDWTRVALTETNYFFSNYFIASLPIGSFVIYQAYPDACAYCKSQHYKVFIVSNPPFEDYSKLNPTDIKYWKIATIWETCIWPGKNNFKRRTTLYKRTPAGLELRWHHERSMPCTPAHPWCRCRWFRFDPEVQFVNAEGRIKFRLKEREEEYQLWLKANPHIKERGIGTNW